MQTIRQRNGVNRVTRHWGGFIVYLCNNTTRNIVTGKYGVATIAAIIAAWGITAKIAGTATALIAFSAHLLERANAYNRGVRVWLNWVPPVPPLWKPLRIRMIDAQR
ncbi:MAG: hypothetical protein PQ964_05260 [Methanobacteriaceae archaeon]|jgi:hypothetical protein